MKLVEHVPTLDGLKRTTDGSLVVFHVDRNPFARPGASLPDEWVKEAIDGGGPWFFMPADGFRTNLGDLRGYPLLYSTGFASEDEALDAAEGWTAHLAQRRGDPSNPFHESFELVFEDVAL